MKRSRVLEKIRRDEPALGVTLHLTDPSLFELVGLMGFDAIWMDMEHHAYSLETAAGLMRGARVGGTDIIARPGKGEFMRMSRMLEIGATGIMYPRCDSVEEAKEVVRWSKFAPIGQRGFDGSGPDSDFTFLPMTRYLEDRNDQTLLIIQLEEQKAVDQAEAILALPGVDMVMLGPADFTVLSGIPAEFQHEKVQAAYEKVAEAARNTGKTFAATCGTLEHAQKVINMGARLVFHSCDLIFVRQGLEQVRKNFGEKLGMTFAQTPDFAGQAASYQEKTG